MRVIEPAPSLTLSVALANWIVIGSAGTVWENSDVSFVERLVAVADRNGPVVGVVFSTTENAALPLASVVTWIPPSGVWPWPKPVLSTKVLAKNWIRKVWFGTLFSVPWAKMFAVVAVADVMMGKFWK